MGVDPLNPGGVRDEIVPPAGTQQRYQPYDLIHFDLKPPNGMHRLKTLTYSTLSTCFAADLCCVQYSWAIWTAGGLIYRF